MSVSEATGILNAMGICAYTRLLEYVNENIDIPEWTDYNKQVDLHLTYLVQYGKAPEILGELAESVILDPLDPLFFVLEDMLVYCEAEDATYTVAIQTDPHTVFVKENPGKPYKRESLTVLDD